MPDAPVFGRRQPQPIASPIRSARPQRPLPTLEELGFEPSDDGDQLKAWRKARWERYLRSIIGWRGAGAMMMLAGLGLKLAGLDLLSLLASGLATAFMTVGFFRNQRKAR